jgi:hypothetical protein
MPPLQSWKVEVAGFLGKHQLSGRAAIAHSLSAEVPPSG